MRYHRYFHSFCILFFCSLFLACGCKGKRGVVAEQPVRIATLKGPSSMGMIQLIDSAKTLQIDLLSEPLQVRKLMLEGEADFAVLPMNMAALLYNKGLEYVLLASPVSGSLYLAGTDTTAINWEQLRGKKVYIMAKGMTPDAVFHYLALKNGLDTEQELTSDYSFPTHVDLANAMAADRAPLGVISEPYLSLVQSKNPHVRQLMDLNKEWQKKEGFPIAETAFLVKKSFLQTHPDRVAHVLDAYEQSSLWVNAHLDSAAHLIVKHNIIPDIQAARAAIGPSNLLFRRTKDHKAEIQAYLRIINHLNPEIIGGKLPDEAFYQ